MAISGRWDSSTVGMVLAGLLAALLVALGLSLWFLTPETQRPPALPGIDTPSSAKALDALPLSFEPNVGQFAGDAQFAARGSEGTTFLTASGAAVTIPGHDGGKGRTVRLDLFGATPTPKIEGVGRLGGVVNSYEGDDPARWQSGIPTYSGVAFRHAYPGVDVVFRGAQERLEYDFNLAAGADPDRIGVRLRGGAPHIKTNGDLAVRTPAGTVVQHRPVAYQRIDGRRVPVSAHFVLKGNRLRFALGSYDATRRLVIDPVVEYSDLIGGNGADNIFAVAAADDGTAYYTGVTTSSNYPITNGSTHSSGTDAFIARMNPSGSGLVFSTYLGGGGDIEQGEGIALDSSGNAYVQGWTNSDNFPTTNAAFDTSFNGASDSWVAKLSAAGQVGWSTYLGGDQNDTPSALDSIELDGAGNVFVTGTAGDGFPTTAGAYQTGKQGSNVDSNHYVTKLNPSGSGLVYSTYLGGPPSQNGEGGIAVDSSGSAYVTGPVADGEHPTTAGAFRSGQVNIFGDAWVSKLNPAGSALVYSTLLGGDIRDIPEAIDVDGNGNAYVVGLTDSANFPVTAGVAQATNGSPDKDVGDGFVTKLNPTGTGLVWSTFLGGDAADDIRDVDLDAAGDVWVVGQTKSTNYPLQNKLQSRGGSQDGVVTELAPDAKSLKFSTYYGGAADDVPLSLEVAPAPSNAVLFAGASDGAGFPTTAGAKQPPLNQGPGGGPDDGILVKLTPDKADLTIDKTDSQDPVAIGDEFFYTLKVTNSGPQAAADATVTDQLPPGVDFVSADQQCGFANATVTCQLGAINSGASVSVNVHVRPTQLGQISNTATVATTTDDSNPNNNSDTETTDVQARAVDLSIDKTDGPDPIRHGETTTYTLTIHNDGPRDATEVQVEDVFPSNMRPVTLPPDCTQSASGVDCTIGTVPAGGDVTREIVARGDSVGRGTNTADVFDTSSAELDGNSENDEDAEETTVLPSADVSVTKTDRKDPVEIGDDVDYTVRVRNAGPDLAKAIVMTDYLPKNTTFVSAKGCKHIGKRAVCHLGDMASGAKRKIGVSVKTRKGGHLLNVAEVGQDPQVDVPVVPPCRRCFLGIGNGGVSRAGGPRDPAVASRSAAVDPLSGWGRALTISNDPDLTNNRAEEPTDVKGSGDKSREHQGHHGHLPPAIGRMLPFTGLVLGFLALIGGGLSLLGFALRFPRPGASVRRSIGA